MDMTNIPFSRPMIAIWFAIISLTSGVILASGAPLYVGLIIYAMLGWMPALMWFADGYSDTPNRYDILLYIIVSMAGLALPTLALELEWIFVFLLIAIAEAFYLHNCKEGRFRLYEFSDSKMISTAVYKLLSFGFSGLILGFPRALYSIWNIANHNIEPLGAIVRYGVIIAAAIVVTYAYIWLNSKALAEEKKKARKRK